MIYDIMLNINNELLTYQCTNSDAKTDILISDINVQILSVNNDKNINITYTIKGINSKSFNSGKKFGVNSAIKSTGTFVDTSDSQNNKTLKIEFSY